MGDGGGRAALAPWVARVIPLAFLGLTLLTRFSNAVYWSGIAGGVVLVVLFVLPLLYTVPRGRVLWAHHCGWLLMGQAVLTYAPLAVFGQDWINIAPGLLVGLVLLAVAPPRSWLLFGAVVVVEAVRIVVLGIPWPGSDAAIITWMLAAPAGTGMAFFGLVRLADMVTALHAARTELADLAVTQERRWSADRLRAATGDHLDTVVVRARAALAGLPSSPDQARAQLAEASGSARLALDQIRTVMAADRSGPRTGPEGHGHGAGPSGANVVPRLARVTLVAVLGANAAILMSNILVAGGAPIAMAGAAGTIGAVSALQLSHSFAWRAGARPRAWGWTLAAQTLLPFAWLPAYDWNVLTLAGLAAGSALLLLPRRWAWTAFTAVLIGVGVAWSLPVLGVYYGINNQFVYVVAQDNATVLYQIGAVATAGIVVYGLSRLTDLAEQVEAVRRELARTAVERERSRVAQDTHDFLGLGLSAVALKSDLAGRLIGRDDARARAELEALLRLAAQARTEIRSVITHEHGLSLRTELAAAHDVLASAGIAAEVPRETSRGPLPEEIDAALATMLREAVTNVLRHAKATRCEIELAVDQGDIVVRVANDGVTGQPDGMPAREPPRRPGGRGMANMSARAVALGGGLSAHTEGDRFELTVRVPLPAEAPGWWRDDDALATGDPAHGVDEVVGRAAPDRET
jgi:two-component system sensor histidine kinase DesK